MGKRPQISDELHNHVHDIHNQYQNSSAGSFEEALKTVVQLAEMQVTQRNEPDPGWYPGKYISEVASALSDIGKQETPDQRSTRADQHAISSRTGATHQSTPHKLDIELDSQVVCKATLDENGRITLPEPERQALGLTPGQILQLIAYPIKPKSDTGEETTTERQ